MREWYAHSDKLFAKLEKRIQSVFERSRLTLGFDEINASTARSEASRIYTILKKLNRKCFEDIMEYVYYRAYLEAMEENKQDNRQDNNQDKRPGKLGSKWLDRFLKEYNPVTKYVYEHEVERKEARFFEAVVADKEADDRRALEQDYKTARNLWKKQAKQYFVDVEDASAKQAYKDAGVKRVMWITEEDDRVCGICAARHGLIFPIDRVPDKPHYGCRCTLKPVKR